MAHHVEQIREQVERWVGNIAPNERTPDAQIAKLHFLSGERMHLQQMGKVPASIAEMEERVLNGKL